MKDWRDEMMGNYEGKERTIGFGGGNWTLTRDASWKCHLPKEFHQRKRFWALQPYKSTVTSPSPFSIRQSSVAVHRQEIQSALSGTRPYTPTMFWLVPTTWLSFKVKSTAVHQVTFWAKGGLAHPNGKNQKFKCPPSSFSTGYSCSRARCLAHW